SLVLIVSLLWSIGTGGLAGRQKSARLPGNELIAQADQPRSSVLNSNPGATTPAASVTHLFHDYERSVTQPFFTPAGSLFRQPTSEPLVPPIAATLDDVANFEVLPEQTHAQINTEPHVIDGIADSSKSAWRTIIGQEISLPATPAPARPAAALPFSLPDN